MEATANARLRTLVRFASPLAAALAAAMGLIVLIGWLAAIEFLKSLLHPARIAMNPATAIGFILSGTSLWLQSERTVTRSHRIAKLLALLAILIGAYRLIAYLAGWGKGIDSLLFPTRLHGNVMAPNTAVAFILMGLALLLLDVKLRAFHPAQLPAILAACISFLALVGYLYSLVSLYGVAGYIPMALNTALTFMILATGTLCARPQREPVRTLLSDTVGGMIARRLVPAAFIVPVLLGYLRILGQRSGAFAAEFGLSLLVLGNVIVFNLLVWWSAKTAERLDLQRRRAHDALKEAQSQLVQSEKLAGLGQMVAGVAHEINNPLAFVSNNIVVLQRDVGALVNLLDLYARGDDLLTKDQPQLADQIRDLAARMDLPYTRQNIPEVLSRSREGLRRIQQIVKDLRDFARLDRADQQDADINAGIESTVNIVQGHAKKKQVTIDLNLQPLPLVMCHPARINQVVMNLLTNAIDACPTDGKVTVRTLAQDQRVRIEISDTGPGVDPIIAEKIFDPFFTTKPQGQGTGLGLSISYGIVKDHGGTIQLESPPGKGATFIVQLPVRLP